VIAEARLALDAAGRSVAAFSPEGRLLWSTPRAAELLGRGFGAEPSTTPAAVVEWLGRLDGRPVSGVAPLEVETGAEAVALTWLGRSATGSVLVRVGRPETGVPGRRLALALGLTPREGEVLGWLSSGKSNRDIAAILGLSPRTVNKHLEQIYAKLGIENRTAAVGLALRALER
jgi:DNA-binding CsgD family transcriptional regulator